MTVRELVEQSRAAQGLSPTVDDPAVVARLAILLGHGMTDERGIKKAARATEDPRTAMEERHDPGDPRAA